MTIHRRLLYILIIFITTVLISPPIRAARPITLSTRTGGDSLYNALHPRLLFTNQELPALSSKVRDGGKDDAAYDFIRLFAEIIYPYKTMDDLLGMDFGLHAIPNLGLTAYLESPMDTISYTIGHDLTLYIANNWDVGYDIYYASLRLRSLALGYDMFFGSSPQTERDTIKSEMQAYINTMLTDVNFEVYNLQPYMSNKTAMLAAALGIAAICLEGEIDSTIVQEALAKADELTLNWLYNLVDENGSYNEGVLYGAWSLQHLIYYFYTRKRYDGCDYAENPKLRSMERWFVYELLPEGHGKTNNINDSSYIDYPLSLNNTYFDWALSEWNSTLSAWIWDHTEGDYGYDNGIFSDKAGTVLWHRELVPQQPDSILNKSFLWQNRGLYYFRTGWQSGMSSNDVMFSFYSGKFQGGHAQEDQNNFTLYAYGGKFAIDNGIGNPAKQSEAHNLILIDGKGQHNAGASIGTDGDISTFLINDFADYLQGDATLAYNTYSPLNRYGFPLLGSDWSWGYDGGNPVNFALRNVIVVHDSLTAPYIIMLDDIQKDGSIHSYQWRMHTYYSNSIDTTSNPIRISSGNSFLDIYALNPSFGSMQKSITAFNNQNGDPNSNVISLTTNIVNPHFAFLLIPGDGIQPQPTVQSQVFPWGIASTINWGSGKSDIFLANFSGGEVIYSFQDSTTWHFESSGDPYETHNNASSLMTLLTDASMALVRIENGMLKKYMLTSVTVCAINDMALVSIANGPTGVAMSGGIINIDRYDADFTFYAPGVSKVFYRGQEIFVLNNNGYLTPDPFTSVRTNTNRVSPFSARIYPNPFSPSTKILIIPANNCYIKAVIYDSLGRKVKSLWSGEIGQGPKNLTWRGTNENGERVASGVYILKISSGSYYKVLKLTMIK